MSDTPYISEEKISAEHGNTETRAQKIADKNTTPDFLHTIATTDPSSYNRALVAKQKTVTPETLQHLSSDPQWAVKAFVANNPNTPEETLAQLALGDNQHIKNIALNNPNLPQWVRDLNQIANM